jgi:hypothetical protein
MIRFIVGLLLCMGAVEANPETPIIYILTIAGIGLLLMFFGTRKMTMAP